MTKTERLFYLLKLLNCKEKIRLSDIAAACKTSERTVFRDLRTLDNLGFTTIYDNGYSLASHNPNPLPGPFSAIELRLIRFALETHQLGNIFPFADLAARLDNVKLPATLEMNWRADSEFKIVKNESAKRMLDKTRKKPRWFSKVVGEKEESKG